MSIINVEPELLAAAAGDLSSIGSVIEEAGAAAATPTAAVLPPAADEVSAQLVTLFTGQAESYQAVGAQAAVAHQDFVRNFAASAESYAASEAANASPLQTLEHALLGGGSGLHLGTGSGALAKPFQGLGILNSGAPHVLGSGLSARFPMLSQIFENQLGYWQQFFTALKTMDPSKIGAALQAIKTQIGANLTAVGKLLLNDVASITGNVLTMSPLLDLWIDSISPGILAMASLDTSWATFTSDLTGGNLLGALGALVKAPFNAAHDFLFGSYTGTGAIFSSMGITSDIQFTLSGLLTGLNPMYEIMPDGSKMLLQGAQFGGLFAGLNSTGQQIAKLIAPTAELGALGSGGLIPHVPGAAVPGVARPLEVGLVGSAPLAAAAGTRLAA